MFTVLSEQLESVADNLATTDLVSLGGVVDVENFIDVLQHAAAIAAEVEHEAARSAILARTSTTVAYPPLVAMLGRAIGGES
jgi:hypothetical protein